MGNKRTLFIILTITLVGAIVIPILFRDSEETANQTINVIVTIVSSMASLLTLVIAILLFNKFGIETPLLEKNTSTVFNLIEEMKKVRFFISGDKYSLMVRLHDSSHTSYESWYSERLAFSTEYIEGLDRLFKISDSPFMPKTIYEKVDRLRFFVMTIISDEDLKKYATVQVAGQSLIGAKYGRFNEKDMTLLEFLDIIDDIKTETVNWISKHSNFPADLNL
ncbi:MAG: hypothetical protein V4635_05975 [Bacteroidota bacterium]